MKNELLQELVACFVMSLKREEILRFLNQELIGKSLTLYKHALGEAVDTYVKGRPFRIQELAKKTLLTGKAEGFKANGQELVLTIEGKDFNLTLERIWLTL